MASPWAAPVKNLRSRDLDLRKDAPNHLYFLKRGFSAARMNDKSQKFRDNLKIWSCSSTMWQKRLNDLCSKAVKFLFLASKRPDIVAYKCNQRKFEPFLGPFGLPDFWFFGPQPQTTYSLRICIIYLWGRYFLERFWIFRTRFHEKPLELEGELKNIS